MAQTLEDNPIFYPTQLNATLHIQDVIKSRFTTLIITCMVTIVDANVHAISTNLPDANELEEDNNDHIRLFSSFRFLVLRCRVNVWPADTRNKSLSNSCNS